ncbi:uncharacterized protein CC84DRAFT_1163244 [Paraphaeosphaeria sporulosa]|uniref:RCC1/BLIP-II n=1 Tax=Paraphaeosphaeria sporulosa TaxID=1460663 RepID=A0A177CI27_9PLEO|nr:uncharacterized protein CC84DRAFT_1163244 [Paraphaeosphaeria sporulosa]OAG06966.1 hypothetical protein CC84DRAFT_1163244 [Paraphaeosphaeria sporulosa]
MDELYVFGYGYNQQFPKTLRQDAQKAEYLDVKSVSTPTCVLSAEEIVIVWASWCDLIIIISDTYRYTGTSLLPAQITAITTLPASLAQTPVFFGRPDTSGVLGFITPSRSTLTIFSTPHEIAQGAPPTQTTSFASSPRLILAIHFTASDAVIVHSAHRATNQITVVELPSLQHVHDFIANPNAEYITRTDFPLVQVTTNIATLTAVSQFGTTHTLATDRRFARAAGRDPDSSTETAQPVPFLEQTWITRVAAGGLYTAALAEDGELFLWGQAMAGTPGELRCLANKSDDDDEYVRTVDLGEGASVVDLAVGAGHVLVAVERGESREVWAAGDNRNHALGLGMEMKGRDFVNEFVAIEGLKGEWVKQMVCAGMSSYVVVKADSMRGNDE